jgi:HEPN domain-containing protein
MNDVDHARDLLKMARADLNALRGMLKMDDSAENYFSDEIFGFHAQQAVEKILKARIASLGGSYTKTHDLMALLDILEDLGQDVAGLGGLVDLNSFAVQYRYESFDIEDEKLDREDLHATVEVLYQQIENNIG